MLLFLKKILGNYLFLTGVLAHVFIFMLFALHPYLLDKVTSKAFNYYYTWQKKQEYNSLTQGINYSIENEIDTVFSPWKAIPSSKVMKFKFEVNGIGFIDISKAVSSLKDGDELYVAEGVYETPITINKNNITITGIGHVVFRDATVAGKGFILSRGDNLTVNNIECSGIKVRDGNGSCIRLEGKGLSLNYVYFHNSQEGVLETAKEPGLIQINSSRFERLGFNGQAHGIYTNKASVHINDSLFVATKSQGHAIKVRGEKLIINNSILTSLSSDDSRLIDMPNGGEMVVVNSLLSQGPNSVNGQAIGFGLEGLSYSFNRITFTDNIVYLERIGVNYLLVTAKGVEHSNIRQNKNIIIGKDESRYVNDLNAYFSRREELGLPLYPILPKSYCDTRVHCVIK